MIDVRSRRLPVAGSCVRRAARCHLRRPATGELASNDQRPIWDRGMWLMPWHYLVTLRRGTVRQALAVAPVA